MNNIHTAHVDLIAEIMDNTKPKNEHELAAAIEIEQLNWQVKILDESRIFWADLAEKRAIEIEKLREKNEELKRPRCDADHIAVVEQLQDNITAYAEILADKQRNYDTLSKNASQLFDQRTELLLKVNAQANEIERLREVEATAEIIFETNKKQRAEINTLRQLLVMIENTGFLTQGLDSGSTHRAICKKWQQIKEA